MVVMLLVVCYICIGLFLGLSLHPLLLSFHSYTRIHDPLVLQHKVNTHNYSMHMCSELDFMHRTSHTMKIQICISHILHNIIMIQSHYNIYHIGIITKLPYYLGYNTRYLILLTNCLLLVVTTLIVHA